MGVDTPKIYRYVLVSDDGMAPCIDNGLVSLATCKPVIRRCASEGDWVLACYDARSPRGTLAWVGRIERIPNVGEYERAYRGRSDAVYRENSDGSFRRLRKDYHVNAKEKERDLSGPSLVFTHDSTWFFGTECKELPPWLIHLAPRGQGHRVNFRQPGDLEELVQWLNRSGKPGVHGQPRDQFADKNCGQLPKEGKCGTGKTASC